MKEGKGFANILRATSISGAASVVNVLVGLVRMKVAAVLLGPSGVGSIGLLQTFVATAATVATLGMGNAGTRQVAEASGRQSQGDLAATRIALLCAATVLAVLGGLSCVALREPLAGYVFGDARRSGDVAWMGLGVAFTVAAGLLSALLNGLRRITDLARINIGSALLGAAISILALYIWPDSTGLMVFVLAVPACTLFFSLWFAFQLERDQWASSVPTSKQNVVAQWRTMLRVGIAFMLGGFITNGGQLLARGLVQYELGSEGLGHFQAAWSISMTYIGFVLSAMATDYYPRLTAVVKDNSVANTLINEQTEIALLLAGPLLLLLMGAAPWVIRWMYSSAFVPAGDALRLQLLGDMLKVASWPLGFVMLSVGAGRSFLLTETLAAIVYLIGLWLLLPKMGLMATGAAYVIMYMAYLMVVHWFAGRLTGFKWSGEVKGCLVGVTLSGCIVLAVQEWSALAALALSIFAAIGLSGYAVARLSSFGSGTRLGKFFLKLKCAVIRNSRKASS